MGWALRFGMTISIVGALSGGLMARPTEAQLAAAAQGHRMTVAGAHTVGAPDGGAGLPGTGWSRTHGDLRIGHFVGLHALQVLPLLALVCAAMQWPQDRRTRLMIAASASYFALFVLLMWQAFRGVSLVNPDPLTGGALVLWGVLTIAALGFASYRRAPLSVGAMVH
jgi:hypothetical protein